VTPAHLAGGSSAPAAGRRAIAGVWRVLVCAFVAAGQPDCAAIDAARRFQLASEAGDLYVYDTDLHVAWQRAPSPPLSSMASASAYCAALGLGGFTDWKVPFGDLRDNERTALYDKDQAQAPYIDKSLFPDTPCGCFLGGGAEYSHSVQTTDSNGKTKSESVYEFAPRDFCKADVECNDGSSAASTSKAIVVYVRCVSEKAYDP